MRWGFIVLPMLSLSAVSCGGDGAGSASAGGCALTVTAAPDGTPKLDGDCPRDAASVASAIARAPGLLRPGGEIALRRTSFGSAGVFDRCAVMARLADDPRWTASIDSVAAVEPLRDALGEKTLASSVADALARARRTLHGVSVETVLLSDGPARDCVKSPARAPIEAQVWLSLA